MSAIVNWGRNVLCAERPQHPSLLWTLRQNIALRGLNQFIGMSIPFVRRNHFQIVELRTGYLKATISLQKNKNHLGTMYAGAMFVLAEVPGGVVALFEFGSGYYPILKELNIRYLLFAQSDLTVEVTMTQAQLNDIRQQADAKGKSDFTLNLDLRNVNGVVVAQTTALYQLRVKK